MDEKQILTNLLIWNNTDNIFDISTKDILLNSKIFQLETDVIKLLNPLYTNNKMGFRKMPFPKMMIPNSFKLGKYLIRGMNIHNTFWEGSYSIQASFLVDEGNKVRGYQTDIISKRISPKLKEKGIEWNDEDNNIVDLARIFMCNFIDFMNNPEIEIIKIDRNEEQNLKRIKRGKLPIPSYNFVKVTGKLKIYINSLQSGNKFSYSHKFWVRGHFRTLKNESRYKNNTGQKLWITPYIKGEGLLINKIYDVGG